LVPNKQGLNCNTRTLVERAAFRYAKCYGCSNSAPQPQLRKIKQIAVTKKFARWVAMRPLLKVRLRCKACHAEERAAFRSAPPTPLPHLRKIKQIATPKNLHGGSSTIRYATPHPQRRKIKQIAVAEKAAWWAAM